MERPLISCIVPVYNGQVYLCEAIDSILEQTYRPIEILAVDDGSTDGSAAILRSYSAQILVFHQENGGPSAARNHGIRKSRGEFIAFLDADDLWHPRKLTRQMDRFAERPGTEVCITHFQNFWMPALEKDAEFFRGHRYSLPMVGYTLQTLLARRSIFERVGYFDPVLRWGEDVDWFARAAEKTVKVEVIQETLTYRRIHGANLCMEPNRSTIAPQALASLLSVVKTSLDRRRQGQRTPAALPAQSAQDGSSGSSKETGGKNGD
jgi:glycosyltransferase involved in cell wall biosynthesis